DGERGENVCLPSEILQIKATINNCKHQGKACPHCSNPCTRSLVPRQKREQSSCGERVQVRYRACRFAIASDGLARKEIQAGSHNRHREQAQRETLPNFFLQCLVESERAYNRGRRDGITLPREVLVIDPTHRRHKCESEGDPGNGDPWSGRRFEENPRHEAGCRPAVSRTANIILLGIRNLDSLRNPIRTCDYRKCRKRV